MSRIKIQDLTKDLKISQDDMKRVMGGIDTVPLPDMPVRFRRESKTTYVFVPEFIPYR